MYQASARHGVSCELLRDGNGPKLALVDDNSAVTQTDSTFDAGQTLAIRRTGATARPTTAPTATSR